jgi:acyl-CoA thioesterase-1
MDISNRKVRYTIFFIISLLVIFFVYTKFFKAESIKNYPSAGKDIVAFGDSLIFGQGASSEDKNFVSLLSDKIDERIVNLGVPGNTTQNALDRINELEKYNPKVVILLLGGNDYLQKVPIEKTFKNLGEIIQKIQSKGSVVLLLGVRGGVLNDKFDIEFEKISSKYHTAYVSDVLSGLITNMQYMSDAVHPNDLGYQKIADRVYPVLVNLIKK